MSDKIGVKLRTGIVVSKKMERFLNEYSHVTIQFFFDLDPESVKTNELNFLDVEDQKITYIDTQKYRGLDLTEAYSPQFKSKRIQISPSRIFSKLFDEKMVSRHMNGHDLEYFANLIKSYFGPPLNFKVVTGEDIKKYYSGKTYTKGNGTLNKSCMRYDENQDFFRIYLDNSKMLVGFDESGNVSARALLWDEVGMIKDDKEPTQFIKLMDRIYTNLDKDVVQLKDWAKDNGYAYKYEQNHHDKETIVIDGKKVTARLFVNIPNLYDYSLFPYMDTFSYGFGELNILSNKIYKASSVHLARHSYLGPHNSFHDTNGKYVQCLEEWRPVTDHMKYRPMQYFNADYNMYLKWLNSTFGTNFEEVKYQEKLAEIQNENTNLYQRMREQVESIRQQARERQEAIVTAVQRPDEQQMSDLESRMRQVIRENTERTQRYREERQGGAAREESQINYGNLSFHGLSGIREQYVNSGDEIIQSLRQSLQPEPTYRPRISDLVRQMSENNEVSEM